MQDERFQSFIQYDRARQLSVSIGSFAGKTMIGLLKMTKWDQDSQFHASREHIAIEWKYWRTILASLNEFTDRIEKLDQQTANIKAESK